VAVLEHDHRTCEERDQQFFVNPPTRPVRVASRRDRQRGPPARCVDPACPRCVTDPVTFAIAIVSGIILLTTELDALWIILASAAVSLSASSLGLMASFG
jgi:hypothetical protein